jgi:hypothetical protein
MKNMRATLLILIFYGLFATSWVRAALSENYGLGFDISTVNSDGAVLAIYFLTIDISDSWEDGGPINIVLEDNGTPVDFGAAATISRSINLLNPTQWGVIFELEHEPLQANHQYCLLGTSEVVSYNPALTYQNTILTCFPYPLPSLTACGDFFLGCPPGCGSSPYLMSWSGQYASTYRVQKQIFGTWANWYTGSSTQSFASTGTNYAEFFRVRAENAGGNSGWCNIALSVQCSELQHPW